MTELSRLTEGVPYRQRLKTYEGHMHDNFYLMKLNIVKRGERRLPRKHLYLFTTKELVGAVNRYLYDMQDLNEAHERQLMGYLYPVSYHNRNGVLTERHLCKFSGRGVVGLNTNDPVLALFSNREIRRAEERTNTYIRPSFWMKMWKGIQWLFRLITRHVES